MKGFILAAGYGERLRPVTDVFPKPLVPVANVPSICYAISILARAGISSVIINLHYRSDKIREFFDGHDNFGLDISFSYEPKILGTGGGVMKCREMIGGDDFVLINSDVIMDMDLAAVLRRHRERTSPGTVVLYRATDAASIGQVGVREERVIDFKNFLGTNVLSGLIYAGAAVLSPAIFQYLEDGFSSIVYTGYTGLIVNRRLDYVEHDGLWLDIGTVASLREASMRTAATGMAQAVAAICGLESAPVASDAQIAAGAVVRDSIIGAGSIVGADAEVLDSLLLPGSRVEAGARISRAVVLREEIIRP
ncbi:MAG TPA: NDP-sugar synthase [Spirochaetota bacterium]|nr:NDP-sugar synthase [Spirochaetota bacterium]